ncbi:ATP-dependent DNA ligase [Patulibacter brassicae]|uniref:DNA ligase (ATP) n=1 Tax=Patulibacter brassicae TaxID=1705717 RepID=A0ABU4VIF4_9ACTN|nr:ATP-dependent DNA ligase [Patulibacter brassicae]MDX8151617.1 ATP-dependent DNA ligase [Patulibacter brassicae]
MPLPLDPPLAPQLARGRASLPTEDGWAYEPKYDGFRAIAFVDGDAVRLCSRGGKDLERYFPEVVLPAGRYVLDGELVIDRTSLQRADPPLEVQGDDPEQFDLLSQRIHPAASRIERLARETPARYLAFDLLALEDDVLLDRPFAARRAALEELLGRDAFALDPVVDLVPSVRTAAEAQDWLARTEGVVAKELDAPYRPGARKGMVKVKRLRTIDAVVVGWRPGKEEGTVGSLILGLYDEGELRVVGHTSGLKAKEKRELVATLAPYASGAGGSADPSRWSSDRELEWVGLRPELVVEVSFDQVSGGRIRHGTRLLRWREDKAPEECLFDQLSQG